MIPQPRSSAQRDPALASGGPSRFLPGQSRRFPDEGGPLRRPAQDSFFRRGPAVARSSPVPAGAEFPPFAQDAESRPRQAEASGRAGPPAFMSDMDARQRQSRLRAVSSSEGSQSSYASLPRPYAESERSGGTWKWGYLLALAAPVLLMVFFAATLVNWLTRSDEALFGQSADDEGFCCVVSKDPDSPCDTCLPQPSSYCGRSRSTCMSCGHTATWCPIPPEEEDEEEEEEEEDDAAGTEAVDSSFCCLAARDTDNYCGTCWSTAKSHPGGHCSHSRTKCLACAASATWCEGGARGHTPVEKPAVQTTAPATPPPRTTQATTAPAAPPTMPPEPFSPPTRAPRMTAPATTRAPAGPIPRPTVIVDTGFVAKHGKLKLAGLQLADQHGRAVRLIGLSSHGLQWFHECYTRDSLAHLARDWGITLFRAAMYVGEDGYATDASVLILVRNIVQWCEELGIYVIIDWHVLNPGNPNYWLTGEGASKANALKFWTMIAKQYRDKPHVIYEICNEPNGVPWGEVKAYADTIIKGIREVDPKTIIVVGTPTYSQDIQEAAAAPVAMPHNVMYAFHFYAGSHEFLLPRVKDIAHKVPLFVTEWGTSEATGAGGPYLDIAKEFMDLLGNSQELGVTLSCSAWSYADKREVSATLRPHSCFRRRWNAASESGKFIRSYARAVAR